MSLRSQRGFTLMEIMASMSATAVVIGAASALLLRCFAWYDELSAKLAINRHARETYDILSLGGKSSSAGNDGTQNIYGIEERKSKPGGPQRTNYAFSYVSNNLTLAPDKVSSMAVTCTATAVPLPDCPSGGPGANKTVTGWIGKDIQMDDGPSVPTSLVNVTLTIVNPFQAQRAKGPAVFSEVYHIIFTKNREETDP